TCRSNVPSPNQGRSTSWLGGVAAVSANDVWAVGYSGCCDRANSLIEHWDGSTWKIVPSPNPGAYDNELNGAAAVSANDVWAVGTYRNSNNIPSLTLIEDRKSTRLNSSHSQI